MTHKPHVFFYVQHLLGIGHLARASRIARGLLDEGFEVTLVTGGMPVAGFPGPGIGHIALPPIAVSDVSFSGLVDAEGVPVDDTFKANRTRQLLDAYHDIKPDVVMIEAFPFGRRKVFFELLPLLDAIKSTTPRPLLVSSIRDILQQRSKPSRDAETVDFVNTHFDHVLVHGDPEFARLEDTFGPTPDIASRIVYTGIVCGPTPPPPAPEDQFDVVVSAGGGAVGAAFITAALEAAAQMPELEKWGVITGPNLPQADFDRFAASAPANIQLMRFRTDFPSLLAGARLSISQAGYNTVGDILAAGCRALLIPFSASGETEQTDRAIKLEQLNRAVMLRDSELTGPRLVQAINRALTETPAPEQLPFRTNGARRTAQILRELQNKFAGT